MTAPGPESGTYPPRRDGWFKSSFSSSSSSCVEVRFDTDLVSIRDSKNRDINEPIITVTADEWTRFLDSLRHGTIPGAVGLLTVEPTGNGSLLRARGQSPTLRFTSAEWRAYLAGVHAREFDPPPNARFPHPPTDDRALTPEDRAVRRRAHNSYCPVMAGAGRWEVAARDVAIWPTWFGGGKIEELTACSNQWV